MTDGERMIWAAAYASYLQKYLVGCTPPDKALYNPEGYRHWEREVVIAAAEWAWSCVGNLRDAQEAIDAKMRPEISNMAKCMLEITP